ncbi:ABC transporter substrate-binding protein [Acidovorax sp. DW039]|uniref:ABC transporter substrate-binding protein n=1 Tax=Acidovorax sp. DW039 TaxID=3095606 RepID=UPI00308695DA|nr:ABC transporter substrate-binding protein [Acidovorax sp. DW039]
MQRRQFVSLAPRAAALVAAPAWVGHANAQEGGLSGKTITIGCSAALTGPLAALGKDVKAGVDAAFAQINARGGVHGRSLQFSVLDDGYVVQRSATNVQQMIGQGQAFAFLSCVGTPNNAAFLPMIEDAGIPYVAPLTGASSLRKVSRNVFHVRASYSDEMRRLIQRVTGMGIKDIGFVYLDNGFGREMLDDATRFMGEAGLKLLAPAALAVDGKNLKEVVAQASQAKPAALILATAGTVSVDLVRSIKTTLPGVLMVGMSVTLPTDSFKQLGASGTGIALTMVMPDPNRAKMALVREYQTAMRAKDVQEFNQGTLEAYVNARVLAEGLERAGPDLTRTKLRSALASIRNWDLGGFTIDYPAQAPFAGSRFVELGVLNASGRLMG